MSFVNGVKEVARFSYGTWANDFGSNIAKEFCSEAGVVQNGAKFRDVFKGQTWKTAGENISSIRNNFKGTSIASNTTDTFTRHYNAANLASKADDAAKAAGKAGKLGKFFSKIPGIKGAGKALRKFPILGAALITATEVPNVSKAFKAGGAGEGIKQIGRSTATLAVECGAFAVGSAAGTAIAGTIGQVLCPIPGLGFVLGMGIGLGVSALARKVTKPVIEGVLGKPMHEQIAQQQQAQTLNDQGTDYSGLGYNFYTPDLSGWDSEVMFLPPPQLQDQAQFLG